MSHLIAYIKSRNIHTPRLALVRFLLAFGLLLTVWSNDLTQVANHNYSRLNGYAIRHTERAHRPFEKADLFMIMNPETARVVVMIILLTVMSGFLPQVTAVLFAWACFSIHNYFVINNGGDDIAFVLSFLLLPICLTDPRINTWKRVEQAPSKRNIIANVTLVVIWMHAAWLYFDAFYAKLFTPQWVNGTAVYYYTSHYRLGAPDWLLRIEQVLTLSQFVRVLSWGALLLEMLLALCIFFPARVRKKFILPALFFHFLIIINFGLITFFISIVAVLLLYLDDDETFTRRILFWEKGYDNTKKL